MTKLDEIFKRHKTAVLCYSGGKDSLALLLLCKPYWDRITVVWVNTGCQFPEVIEHMDKVRKLVPHYIELKGNQPEFFNENGFPVDMVPEANTKLGQFLLGEQPVKMCARFDCCGVNKWRPIEQFLLSVKPECVLRADRDDERAQGPNKYEGTEFCFPIFDWTVEDVWKFLQENAGDLLQERHMMGFQTSLDCMCCTAYFRGYHERQEYLMKHHPQLYQKIASFYKVYREIALAELNKIKEN